MNQITKPSVAYQSFLCIFICHPVGSQITAVENKLVVFKIEIGTHFCIIISLRFNSIVQYIFLIHFPPNPFSSFKTKDPGHGLSELLDTLSLFLHTYTFFKPRLVFIFTTWGSLSSSRILKFNIVSPSCPLLH